MVTIQVRVSVFSLILQWKSPIFLFLFCIQYSITTPTSYFYTVKPGSDTYFSTLIFYPMLYKGLWPQKVTKLFLYTVHTALWHLFFHTPLLNIYVIKDYDLSKSAGVSTCTSSTANKLNLKTITNRGNIAGLQTEDLFTINSKKINASKLDEKYANFRNL